MSKKDAAFDVWIVESNTVYKAVPYVVVTDWLQQGRLLENDKAKPSGAKDWSLLGDLVELQAYLPRPEPHRADDESEAMEPVSLDFNYRKPHDDEDDEVDMIPLIDVSLVLLVFFMLIGSSAAATAAMTNVDTPAVEINNALMADNAEGLHIDITLDDDGVPLFALRVGDRPSAEEEKDLRAMAAVLERLKVRLLKTSGRVDLHINAAKGVSAGLTRDLSLGLRAEPFRSRIPRPVYGVKAVQQ